MDLIHTPLVPTPLQPEAATDAEKLTATAEYPDRLAGRVVETLDAHGLSEVTIIFTDVRPTLSELAGAELPEEYRADGHSIAPFLTGRAGNTPRSGPPPPGNSARACRRPRRGPRPTISSSANRSTPSPYGGKRCPRPK